MQSVVVCVTVEVEGVPVVVVGVSVVVFGLLQFSATKRKITCLLLIFKKSRIKDFYSLWSYT